MKSAALKDIFRSYGFILPFAFFISAFILIPVLGAIINSFFKDVPFLETSFIFAGNYTELISDPAFLQSLKFTLLFIAVSVPLELILGMTFALVLNQPLKFRGLLWAAVLIPWAIPSAVAGRIWELIYNYSYGLANFIVRGTGLSSEPINWLGSNFGAFFSIVIADAWKTTPFVTIILVAGLQAVPDNLHRQANIDGANFVQRFLRITLPILKPVMTVALLFRTIDALRIFDMIYVLTGGGPGGATTSLSLYGYNQYLIGDFGYGSAVSVVLFLIALILAIVYIKSARFQEGI